MMDLGRMGRTTAVVESPGGTAQESHEARVATTGEMVKAVVNGAKVAVVRREIGAAMAVQASAVIGVRHAAPGDQVEDQVEDRVQDGVGPGRE